VRDEIRTSVKGNINCGQEKNHHKEAPPVPVE
jgi:hypothetical protein